MKYILKHITQLNLLAVIALLVGALCMWIPSFAMSESMVSTLTTLLLSLVNTILWMYVCYHGNLSRMVDIFAGFPFLLSMSALLPWHQDWRTQLLIILLNLVLLVFQNIDRHQFRSAAEHTFLMTLLLGIASYWLPSVLLLILPIVAMLIFRNTFDWQALFAIFIALIVVSIYAGIAYWLGWIEPVWLHGFEIPYLTRWIPIVAVSSSAIITILCYAGEGLWRGCVFLSYVVIMITLWVVMLVL